MRKIKGYNDFLNEEVGFLKNALMGGAIAASSVSNPVNANTPVGNEPVVPVEVSDTSVLNKDKNNSLVSFVDTLEKENPQLIIDEEIKDETPVNNSNTETLSFLQKNITQFNSTLVSKYLPKLSLDDLDLLSKPDFPFKINYYRVQAASADVTLIPILNINYNKPVEIRNLLKNKKFEVRFNFTRMGETNYYGATINF
jgi:hypothetical protein